MSHELHRLEKIMSDFLTAALAEIDTIANGQADAAETKAAVESLTAKLASDEADAAEVKQVVQALVDKLAAAPAAPVVTAPPTPTPIPTDNSGNAA